MTTLSKNSLVLKIEDFQIIEKAELCFEQGVSVITGGTRNGKTSIIRALRTIISNRLPQGEVIKYGADFARITLEYNGNKVIWTYRDKGKDKGVVYEINGKEFKKVGYNNLFTLLQDESSGFTIDEKNNILNIEGVIQVLFPYGLSDAELFKLFENVFCVSDSSKIFQSFKKEEDENVKQLQNNIDNLNKNKEKIEGIENYSKAVSIDKLKLYKESLTKKYEKLSKLKVDCASLNEFLNILEFIKNNKIIVKDFSNNKIEKLKKTSVDVQRLQEVEKLLNYNISSYNNKEYDLNKVYNLQKYKKDLLFLKDTFKLVKLKSNIIKKDFNNTKVEKLLKFRKDLTILNNYGSIEELKDRVVVKEFNSNKINRLQKIKTDLQQLKQIFNNIKEIKEKLEVLQAEQRHFEHEIAELKICPLCNTVLN